MDRGDGMAKGVIFSKRVVLGSGAADDPLRVAAAAIEIEGARIARVEARESAPEGAYDLGQRLVAPAFVNGHTHLSMSSLRGIDAVASMHGNVVEELYYRIEKHLEPADVRAFVRMGAYESLLAGVGCVWDHYYYAESVAEALAEVGLCGVVAPTLQDLDGPGVGHADAQLEAAARIDDDARLASAGVVAALGPHATDTVSPELWRRICDLAEARNLWMHVHVGQSSDEIERSLERFGCTPVESLRRLGVLDAGGPGMLLVHMMFVGQADLDALDPARHVLAYCPFSQVQFGFPAHVLAWHERGLRFLLGTDCGACNDSMSVQGELRVLAGGSAFATTHAPDYAEAFLAAPTRDAVHAVQAHRQRAFERAAALKHPNALLRTLWDLPGALHQKLPLGQIRAGYVANLAVFDLDDPALWPATDPLRALAMGDTTAALYAMMTAGQWRGTPGDLRRSLTGSEAYREARHEADARLHGLMRRAGLVA